MEKRSDGERTILADEIGAHFILDSRFTGRAEEDDLLDGVRNYQARNFMRAMQRGDQVSLYHMQCRSSFDCRDSRGRS
jgi:hypothetical protein